MQKHKNNYASFEDKASKMIESNPFFMESIVAVREKKKKNI